MNAKQETPATSIEPLDVAKIQDWVDSQREQSNRTLLAFQNKYDTMILIVEMLATLHLLETKNPNEKVKTEGLRSQLNQMRIGLN